MTVDSNDANMNIFIARQPIFDQKKNVYAYELLYRHNFSHRASTPDGEFATLKLIANSLLIGLRTLTAEKIAFINFNRQLILGEIPMLFPKNLLGVEILETVEPEERVINACKKIRRDGYLLVLDDFIFNERFWPFINLADIIKVDFQFTSPEQRQRLFQRVLSPTVKFLAEKVETEEEYKEAMEQGYHYFQGFFFQKPDIIAWKEIPGYKINYMQILKKIHDPVLEFDGIEEIIKHDVSLTYKLLRFINSASFGFRVAVHSIHHALVLLGKREVKKWLSIIVMSGIGKDRPSELMSHSVIRGRFCEALGKEFKLHSEPSELFLLGMFSLVDSFLGRPMDEVLNELPLEDHIKFPLLGQKGKLWRVLQLVKAYEKADWDNVTFYADILKIPLEQLSKFYMDAIEWSHLLQEKVPA